jgi:Flp pilus assembly protein TadB
MKTWASLLIFAAIVALTPLPEMIGSGLRSSTQPSPTMPTPTPTPLPTPATVTVSVAELYNIRFKIVRVQAALDRAKESIAEVEQQKADAMAEIEKVAHERQGWKDYADQEHRLKEADEVEIARLKPKGFSIFGLIGTVISFVKAPFAFLVGGALQVLLAGVVVVVFIVVLLILWRRWRHRVRHTQTR